MTGCSSLRAAGRPRPLLIERGLRRLHSRHQIRKPPPHVESLLNQSKRREHKAALLQVALRIAFGLGVAAIVVGSLLPSDHVPAVANDKIAHFVAYSVLSLLGTWAFRNRWTVALALSFCSLAFALEFAQRYAPGRSMEIADAAVSCLGVCSVATLRWLASLLRAKIGLIHQVWRSSAHR
jgi:VanZ family protein